ARAPVKQFLAAVATLWKCPFLDSIEMSPLAGVAGATLSVMELLNMSRKERNRLAIMVQVKHRKLSLGQAGDVLRLSYRQIKRVWRRYQKQGDAGLVHRLRGRPSARRKPPALRALALARYAEERYEDFGPALMAEQLAKEKLVVDHETLRRWLLASGKRTGRPRRQ